MDLFKAIKCRASHRKFTSDPVPASVIERCVEAAGRAPSPHNEQMWRFVVVQSREKIQEMASAVEARLKELFAGAPPEAAPTLEAVIRFSTFFKDAPVVVCVMMRPYQSISSRILSDKDARTVNELRGRPDILAIGAAVQNFLLAATARGYATCWMSGPVVARDLIERIIGAQPPWSLETMIAMGRPEGVPKQAPKKPVNDIIAFVDQQPEAGQ